MDRAVGGGWGVWEGWRPHILSNPGLESQDFSKDSTETLVSIRFRGSTKLALITIKEYFINLVLLRQRPKFSPTNEDHLIPVHGNSQRNSAPPWFKKNRTKTSAHLYLTADLEAFHFSNYNFTIVTASLNLTFKGRSAYGRIWGTRNRNEKGSFVQGCILELGKVTDAVSSYSPGSFTQRCLQISKPSLFS